MNRAAFRKFEFFDFDVMSQNLGSTLGGVPMCGVAENGLLIFGDELGNIIFADRDLKVSDRKHKIFTGEVLGLAYVLDSSNQNRQYIVALGDDARPAYDATAAYNASPIAMNPVFVIKVFSITDFQHPIQVINATISDSHVTSFAVHSEGLEVAVGYSNGKVLVFTNLISRDNLGRAQTPTVLLTSHFAPVSNLFFCDSVSKSSEVRRIKLFVVMDTTVNQAQQAPATPPADPLAGMMASDVDQDDLEHAGIMVFDVSLQQLGSKGGYQLTPKQSPKALDDKGASKLHACYFKSTSELVVARYEALYTYTVEDKGGAIAILGEKVCMYGIGRYTLIISLEDKAPVAESTVPGSGSASGSMSAAAGSAKGKRAAINVYDTKNRFLCYTSKKQFPANDKVSLVFSDVGVLYLATMNGSLLRYREKDVRSKLQVLLEQGDQPLYSLAINLAAEERLEAAEIMKLYKQYGDHLYNQHEFEAAITQYCHTIGYLPPSYVIIKFLDPYRIANLVTYLEKIRERGLSSSNHITLLISCYAKLHDEAKIAQLLEDIYRETKEVFVKAQQHHNQHQQQPQPLLPVDIVHSFRVLTLSGAVANAGGNPANLPPFATLFDPVQAITTLQTAGYIDLALGVALRYGQHDAYLQLQLEEFDPPHADEALGYLACLSFLTPVEDMIALLQHWGPRFLDLRPQAVTHLLVRLCTNKLDGVFALEVGASKPPAIGSGGGTKGPAATSTAAAQPLGQLVPVFRQLQSQLELSKLPLPREFYLSIPELLPLYADRPNDLLQLLEGIVAQSQQRVLPQKVWTTLIELYLQQYHQTKSSQIEQKLMSLLDGMHVSYDASHVMLLCHIYEFPPGARFLLEKQNYLELVLRQVMQSTRGQGRRERQAAARDLFKMLRKEGTKDPEVFLQVLQFLVKENMAASEDSQGQQRQASAEGRPKRKSSRRDSDSDNDDDDDKDNDDDNDDDDDDDEAQWDVLVDLMDLIEKEGILSPMQVLAVLAQHPQLPLHVVADYVAHTFKEASEAAVTVEHDVKDSRTKLEGTITYVQTELAGANRRRRTSKSKASAAAGKLRAGFNPYEDEEEEEEEDEDEEEREEQRRKEREYWKEVRQRQIDCSKNHEVFSKELEQSTDGFSTVADFFGRSLILF